MVTLVYGAFLLLFYYAARNSKPILGVIAGFILLIAPLTLDVIIHEYHKVVKYIEDVEQQNPNIQNQSFKGDQDV